MEKREIKFRAYDTKNKKWLRVVPSIERILDDEDSEVSHHDIDIEDALYFYPSSPLGSTFKDRVVYQQFTGLLDWEGKEIYEGDILEELTCNETQKNLGVCKEILGGWRIFSLDGSSYWYSWKQKVIGNIFDNSGLLLAKNQEIQKDN